MKRLAGLLMVAWLVAAGCDNKSPQESLTADMIVQVKARTDILKTVMDEASAKSALSKLQDVNAKLKKIRDELGKLGKPSAEVQAALQKDYEKDLREAITAQSKEVGRIKANPALAKALGDEL